VILLVREQREYLREPGAVLETDLGVLEIPEDPAPGDVLETHLGTEFTVRELRGPDFAAHFRRTGAPMLPRDVGLVIGHTGVGVGDRVLDAGTGTGILAASLGRIGAVVTSYERDSEAAAVARENVALAGVGDTVTVRTGDVLDAVDDLVAGAKDTDADSTGPGGNTSGSVGSGALDPDTDGNGASDGSEGSGIAEGVAEERGDGGRFDLVTLDTADAPAVVKRAPELLVSGGFCAVYSPFVEHTRTVVETAREAGLAVDTYETIQRELDVDERGTRPTTSGVGHTGFLTICRRE